MFGAVAGQLDWDASLHSSVKLLGRRRSVFCVIVQTSHMRPASESMSACHVFTNWMNAKLLSIIAVTAGPSGAEMIGPTHSPLGLCSQRKRSRRFSLALRS